MNNFEGKTALVTGAASGIGKALCLELASRGANVVAADLNFLGANETASLIQERGGQAMAILVDVSNSLDVETCVATAIGEYGKLDYMFNNAGISLISEFQDVSTEKWRKLMDINFWGVVYGCQAAYPRMVNQGSGHIINTASLAGVVPGTLTSAYTAAKHAVVGLSMTLRAEARLHGVKVSTACPFFVRTSIFETSETINDYMKTEKASKTIAEMKMLSPQKCAIRILRGVERNKGIITDSALGRLMWWIYRTFPESLPKIGTTMIRKMQTDAGVKSSRPIEG